MGIGGIIALSVLGLLVAFFAVVLFRTLRFTPKDNVKIDESDVSFDKDAAVTALAELIRCKTVSNEDPALEDEAEFQKLIDKLPVLYPNVCKECELMKFPGRALLFHWKGKKADEPSVLMAHYDVVAVEEDKWEKDPFSGEIENGVLWGRGALDTKVTFNGALFSANKLIGDGFVPENDIYLAFSGGEEINGPGARHIVEYFAEKGITPALVVDEGGAVVEDVFPGVKERCGLIGIAEKGLMNVSYSIDSNGGHASAPKPHTPVGNLSAACCAVENHPFPFRMSKPAAEMFDTLGRRSSFALRMIFANLWCFSPILDMLTRKTGGEFNAIMRTTVAFTQMKGSKQPNVIPPTASMVSNIRLNPLDTVASATEYLKKTVNNPDVKIEVLTGDDPSPVSETDCPAWNKVATAVASTWRGCVVSPYLMVQCSDSRHYGDISNHVYRFSAMDLTKEERATIHGNNERIRLETLYSAVEFYIRLIRQC